MSNVNARSLVGGFVTLIAGVATALLSTKFLFGNYNDILKGFYEAGKAPGTVLQAYQQPVFSEIMLLVGIILVVSSIGYFLNRKWAFIVGIIGSVMGIWGGWMLAMFPMMVGLAPAHFISFFINAIVFFTLLIYVNKTSVKLWVTSFVFGMAFVMTFMNGNASLNKIIGIGLQSKKMAPDAPHVAMVKMNINTGLIYEYVQAINWFGAIAFGVVCVAVLYRKDWVLPVAIGASLISIVAGTPVAYLDSMASGELSMFSYGPIISVLVFIALIVFRENLWSEEKMSFRKKVADKVSSKA